MHSLLTLIKSKPKTFVLFLLVTVAGIYLRFYHLEFGLPHTFYADEPELVEPAIKYTYELKNIISNGDYYKLVPVSYVYGTLPVYVVTVAIAGFSKLAGLMNFSFEKMDLYLVARSLTAIVSFLIAPLTAWLAYALYKNKAVSFVSFILVALNWKLIVHGHYVNQDIFLTFLITGTLLSLILYSRESLTRYVVPAGILFGLAYGTKITALISLPLFLVFFVHRKKFYDLAGFILTSLIAFFISNPFSIIFYDDFIFRLYEMLFKEGGLVFDSVDYSPIKYLAALSDMVTPAVFVLFLLGSIITFVRFKNKETGDKVNFLLLASHVVLYLLFFSIQSRRVDRWLLPVLPIAIIFSAKAITLFLTNISVLPIELNKGYYVNLLLGKEDIGNSKELKLKTSEVSSKIVYKLAVAIIFIQILQNCISLTYQFQRWAPKSSAYIWAQKNLDPLKTKLVYTEEGLDPLNKLPAAKVYQFNVYESKNAQLFFPVDPTLYDYVFISSKSRANYQNEIVRKKYPEYAKRWDNFESILSEKFELIKTFEPDLAGSSNLIPLSSTFVYKRR